LDFSGQFSASCFKQRLRNFLD